MLSNYSPTDLALRAVQKVESGEDFKVPSDLARNAVKTAAKLLEWTAESDANVKTFTDFFNGLVGKFKACFVSRRSFKMQEELMFRKYHELRTSDAFQKDWNVFLHQSIGQTATPTFFQFVSHEIFKDTVKAKLEVPECVQDEASQISKEEENALRYVSGYVGRKVQAKMKSSSLPHQDAMILFMCEFSGDE